MLNSNLISRQLEYFAVAYRLKSYMKAARSIPISYQGLKKSINGLEEDLGVKLFDGDASSLEPTDVADSLFNMILGWDRDALAFEEMISRGKNSGPERIDLCLARGADSFIGADNLLQFESLHPGLYIQCHEQSETDVDRMLIDGEFNIGITTYPFSDKLVTRELFASNCIAWAPKDHPLAGQSSLSLNDLNGHVVILPPENCKAYRYLIERFELLGIKPSKVITCSTVSLVHRAAAKGYGIGIGFELGPSASERGGYSIFYDHVAPIPVVNGYDLRVGVSQRKGYVLTDSEKTVTDFIINSITKFADSDQSSISAAQ